MNEWMPEMNGRDQIYHGDKNKDLVEAIVKDWNYVHRQQLKNPNQHYNTDVS